MPNTGAQCWWWTASGECGQPPVVESYGAKSLSPPPFCAKHQPFMNDLYRLDALRGSVYAWMEE